MCQEQQTELLLPSPGPAPPLPSVKRVPPTSRRGSICASVRNACFRIQSCKKCNGTPLSPASRVQYTVCCTLRKSHCMSGTKGLNFPSIPARSPTASSPSQVSGLITPVPTHLHILMALPHPLLAPPCLSPTYSFSFLLAR